VLVSDRLLATTEPLVLATMLCAGAATAFAFGGAATGSLAVAVPPSTLLLVAAIALLATVLPIAAFLGGVRRLGPSRATILGTVEPPLTIGLSALVFGERLTPGQLLGAVLVVSAVVIVQARVQTRPQPVPVALPAPAPAPEPALLAA